MKKIYFVQSLWLLAGTIFAWSTVISDFYRFYILYGSITRISNCVIPNPVTTACFYGAFAFLIAFIWSLFIIKALKANKNASQNKLHLLLIGSSIFALGNLALEIYNFYLSRASTHVTCSGVPADNIFMTPCFIGSVFFVGSLFISLMIKRRK